MSIDKYLRVKQISELTGLSRATIYALEKAGKFPGKVALGERAVAWRESAIEKWMADREAAVKSVKEAKPGDPRKPRKPKKPNDVSPANVAPNIKGVEEHSPELRPPQTSTGFVEPGRALFGALAQHKIDGALDVVALLDAAGSCLRADRPGGGDLPSAKHDVSWQVLPPNRREREPRLRLS